ALAVGLAPAARSRAAGPDDAAAVAIARAAADGPATELDVTLDPGGRRVAGHARLRVVNDGPDPMPAVTLWLYPNTLGERAAALNDINFHWMYPGGFSPGAIEIANLRVDGAGTVVTFHDVPLVGRRALARVALPAPLSPGRA